MRNIKSLLHPCDIMRLRSTAKSDYQLRHVHLSVRSEQLGSHWTDFHEIWCFIYFILFFSKICRENSSFITIWQE